MARLRGEGGCPWDRAQDRETLKAYIIEESYEVIEAIDEKNLTKLCEELGDLMLQVVFQAQLATEEDIFDIYDVCQAINEKLIRRHPHVFAHGEADTPDEVVEKWEQIKLLERQQKSKTSSTMDGVPRVLPALLKAQRIQEKAARMGFDWQEKVGVLDKVREEFEELSTACFQKDKSAIYEEIGDLLFSVVNFSRHLEIDAEQALSSASQKFIHRFKMMEEMARDAGQQLSDYSEPELDEFWEEAKKKES